MKKMTKNEDFRLKNARIFACSQRSLDEIREDFHLNFSAGLTDEQVQKSKEAHGQNKLNEAKKDRKIVKLFKSFLTLFNLILFVIAILDGFISYFFPESQNDKNTFYVTPLILFVIIIISSLISYKENLKSERSASALKDLTATKSTVIRNGKTLEINSDELVVGDIIQFSCGDFVPAEVRLIKSRDLFVLQSSLTGESAPVEKKAEKTASIDSSTNPFDLENILFHGSSIVSGKGTGIVFEVGSNTILGQLNDKVIQKKKNTTFQKGIDSITKLLLILILIIVPMIFLIDGFDIHLGTAGFVIGDYTLSSSWINAFVFSISVAVSLIPSLLPMQVTSNLAKGAIQMSKKDVIVKNINTIFNFGSMDVLCTDKTGTLTEDSSTLSMYFNIDMKNDIRILRLALLNSHFQNGIRSVIDNSILSYGKSNHAIEEILEEGISPLDEIPFDFERKKLSVLLKDKEGKKFMITKGAPDKMLAVLSYVKSDGKIRKITEEDIRKIEEIADEESKKGKRTIILATKDVDKEEISVLDESDMTFIGFLSFEDTPKKKAKQAMEELKEYGVMTKILTGDSLSSSLAVCRSLNIQEVNYLSETEISAMDDEELKKEAETHNLFVKLTPNSKERIVKALKDNGHIVGFMGDGINDAAALKEADIGISFKNATDIAKGAADIIMLENDLSVLKDGIREGRKSYINMMKYVKCQTSSNFGNMISQSIGAIFLPFSPLKAVHIILLDIISDISCSLIPFDTVEEKDIRKPLNFSLSQIRSFMFLFGPLSSLLDMASFLILFFFISPMMLKNNGIAFSDYSLLNQENQTLFISIFQTGFFLESLITQNVVFSFLRTDKIPFIQSRPSLTLSLGILISCLVGFFLIYVPYINSAFDLVSISPIFILILFGLVLIYGLLTTIMKKGYIRKFKRLL